MPHRAPLTNPEDVRTAWQDAFVLAAEAQDAGLVVVHITPLKVTCGGQRAYSISLWTPDGRIWAEASHEHADEIRRHLAGWPVSDGPVELPHMPDCTDPGHRPLISLCTTEPYRTGIPWTSA